MTPILPCDKSLHQTRGDAPCVASLAAGATATCETGGTYTVTADDVTRGYVLNLATVTGDDGDDTTPNPEDGDDWGTPSTPPPGGEPGTPVVSNEDDEDTPVVPPAPDLTMVKSATDASGDHVATLGEIITYTFVVTNTGNVTVDGIAIQDSLLAAAGITPVCGETSLAPGQATTCTAEYSVTQDDVDAGAILNVATATGEDPINDIPVDSPEDDVVTPAPSVPVLTLVKSAALASDADGDGDADAGDTLAYTFLVTNGGPVTIENISLSDPMLAAVGVGVSSPGTELAPGASMTCTSGEYTVTDADVAVGEVVNVATVTGTSTTGTPVGGTSEATVPTGIVPPPPATPEPPAPAPAPAPNLPSTGVSVGESLGLMGGMLLLGGLMIGLAERRRPFRGR